MATAMFVHQIWFDIGSGKDAPHPERRRNVREAAELSGRTYVLWSESDAIALMETECPHLLALYQALPHGINRCDLFRYVLLLLRGGWYLDIDFVCLRALPREDDLVVGEEWPGSASATVHNGVLCSPRGHHLWVWVLNEVHTRLRALQPRDRASVQRSVFALTGPAMLRDVIVDVGLPVQPFQLLCPCCALSPDGAIRAVSTLEDARRNPRWCTPPDNVDLQLLREWFPGAITAMLGSEQTWQRHLPSLSQKLRDTL
jgi:hypothetical protein